MRALSACSAYDEGFSSSPIEVGPITFFYISSFSTTWIFAMIYGCTNFGCSFTASSNLSNRCCPSQISPLFGLKMDSPTKNGTFYAIAAFFYFFRIASGYDKTSKIRLTTNTPVSITKHFIDPCRLPDGPTYMQLCRRSTFLFVISASILASTYAPTTALQSRL